MGQLRFPTVTVRIGFFGAGLIARYHASSLVASGAPAVIHRVYDPDPRRSAQFAAQWGATAAATEDDVFEGIDAVYICTWTAEHPRLVEAAVARGLAVFCEKPLAVDLASAQRMTEVVQRAGITNQVGLVLRSTAGFALVAALVREARAGAVMSVTFRDDQQLPFGGYYGSSWRVDRRLAGAGTLLEHSIHNLDLLEWLVGPVASLGASTGNFHGHPGIEDTVAVQLRFRHGGVGVLTSVWHDVPGRLSNRRLEIFTQHCRIVAEGNVAEAVEWEYESGRAERCDSPTAQAVELRRLGSTAPGSADGAFVEAVANHRAATPDFAVALRAHTLADAVYRSAGHGGSAAVITD